MANDLAVREEVNVGDLRQTAQLLAMSGYFEAKGNGEQAVAQLATKILAGREMGFGPQPFAARLACDNLEGVRITWCGWGAFALRPGHTP